MSNILLNFARLSKMPSARGVAPPERDVPAPLGTIFTSLCLHHLITEAICATFVGSTTASGV